MPNLNLLIVEGNLEEENQNFEKSRIQTHTDSLKDSLAFFNTNLNIDVLNPSSNPNLEKIIQNLKKYDGLIWGGSSLNIYNDAIEIRRQISFMKECFKSVKKVLAICCGMQVAVTAAGGEVKKGTKGSHIGIANDIELTQDGMNNLMYKDKNNKFNTPAFNFDEVVTIPNGAVHLASNNINNIQSLHFKSGVSEIWGLQYHPEITYEKMISIIQFRKDRLIYERNRFKDEIEIINHINFIKEEINVSDKNSRMIELRNWLDFIKKN